MNRSILRAICCAAFAMLLSTSLRAAPEPRYFLPLGGQRGQTVTVKVSGKFPVWPVNTWVHRPGIEVSAGLSQGILSIRIAEDASAGLYWIRLYDPTGASVPLPFFVGKIPEVLESDDNNAVASAQKLSDGPITINAQLEKRGDVDTFAVAAKRGQTLVADLDSFLPFNIPLDAVLQILTPQGFVFAQNDDQLELDPRLAVEIPYDGTWLVRVFGFPAAPNQSIDLVGNDNLLYRLIVTTRPFLDYPLPLATSRTDAPPIELHGWNLPSDLSPLEPHPGDAEHFLALDHPLTANVLQIPIVAHSSLLEAENNSSTEPQRVANPVTVTGSISQPGDVDIYLFDVAAGSTVTAQIESRALGFDLDPVLELTDADGKSLVRVDDLGNSRDVELTHAVSGNGTLQLHVTDLHRSGSSRHLYRLSLAPASPDVRLTCDAHQLAIAPGASVEISVAIERLHGFAEPVSITIAGLPAGITAPEVTSQPGDDSAKKVTLKLTAPAEQALSSSPLRIVGRAGDRTRPATLTTPANNHELMDLWLTVAVPPAK